MKRRTRKFSFTIRPPLFVLRWLVKRNPWLLSEGGEVSRNRRLCIGPFRFDVAGTMQLTPDNKARLQAEQRALARTGGGENG